MTWKVSKLPCGLRVVTDSQRHLETASLGVWVGTGSRHEATDEHGLSHLLEHMAFKGTRRRSAQAIAEDIERVGGDLNAATGVEQTAYYAHVLASDTGVAIDILADILTEATFDPSELEREKGVILQEIGAAEDTPDDVVFDHFNEAAFPGQSIGRPILGTPERVSGFNRDAISSYVSNHYVRDNMVIGAVGAVDHDELANEVQEKFVALSIDRKSDRPGAARYVGGERRVKKRLEQEHIVVGWEGLSFNNDGHYALQVFANAVGGGMSSPLFQQVREKRGLAYSIYTFNWAYSDAGVFGFYAATGASDVNELLNVALDTLAEGAQRLTDDEVARAKAQMKVSLLAGLESPSARSEQIARQVLAFDRVLSREEMIGRVESLSASEIRQAGAAALRSPPTVSAIGPISKIMTPDRVSQHVGGS